VTCFSLLLGECDIFAPNFRRHEAAAAAAQDRLKASACDYFVAIVTLPAALFDIITHQFTDDHEEEVRCAALSEVLCSSSPAPCICESCHPIFILSYAASDAFSQTADLPLDLRYVAKEQEAALLKAACDDAKHGAELLKVTAMCADCFV
jgi:hypothetical protein